MIMPSSFMLLSISSSPPCLLFPLLLLPLLPLAARVLDIKPQPIERQSVTVSI